MENITIRDATDKDVVTIKKLIFDIWLYEYQFDVNQNDFPDLQEIENYYTKKGGHFLVAVRDNEMVGTIACDKLTQDFVLKRMFVHAHYRRLGVAQLLLDRLFEKVSVTIPESPLSFYLSTKEGDALAAKAFYLKNGFRVISKSELPSNFPFFYQDDLFMVKVFVAEKT